MTLLTIFNFQDMLKKVQYVFTAIATGINTKETDENHKNFRDVSSLTLMTKLVFYCLLHSIAFQQRRCFLSETNRKFLNLISNSQQTWTSKNP